MNNVNLGLIYASNKYPVYQYIHKCDFFKVAKIRDEDEYLNI